MTKEVQQQSGYPAYPTTTEQIHGELQQHRRETRYQRSAERARIIAKRALGGMLLATTITTGSTYAYLQHDINEGRQAVADSKPQTHLIYDTHRHDTAKVATYVATGLGTKNPSETADLLTAHRDIGSVIALEYSNKDINIGDLADAVVANARANGYEYLSFDGYSAGGSITLAVAAEIYEKHDDLHIVSVSLNSSPVGEYGLTVKSQEASRIMSDILRFWPSLAYSEKARWAAEVLARHDRYYDPATDSLDTDRLNHEIQDVYDSKINNEKVASGNLISSQFDFIVRHGIAQSLDRLSQDREGKHKPEIFYTLSSNPDDDPVTDVTWSSHDMSVMARKYNMPLSVLTIDGIGHANPGERPDEYNAAIRDHINPIRESVLRVDYSYGGKPVLGEDIFAQIPSHASRQAIEQKGDDTSNRPQS